MANISTSNINKPAPRWFRVTKKIWSTTENTVIAILLLSGHADQSFPMLLFKIGSSYLKDVLDSVMTNGEEYAPSGTTQQLQQLTRADSDPAQKNS